MIGKLKKIGEKAESYAFIILLFIIFLLISYILFIYFKNVRIFANNVLNLSILIIFYIGIYSFFAFLYYKLFIFILIKKPLREKELKKWLKEKNKWRKKVKKKKNRIPLASSKKLQEFLNEVKEINKKLNSGAVLFRSYFIFLIFSFIIGIYILRPILVIKSSFAFFPRVIKNIFKLHKFPAIYAWDKFLRKKRIYYYPFYIPPK